MRRFRQPLQTERIVSAAADGTTRFEVRQRRFRPLVRWAALALATAAGAALAWVAFSSLPPHPIAHVASVGTAIAIFVGGLATVAGLVTVLPHAILKPTRVAFVVHRLGIDLTAPARRTGPRTMHRDEIAGPFVRVDEAIDAEASAATMMRMGGEEMATALAEGARATGGSADTLLWFLFSGSAGSVTVVYRGTTVVLAEALSRGEAEELAHRVEWAMRTETAR